MIRHRPLTAAASEVLAIITRCPGLSAPAIARSTGINVGMVRRYCRILQGRRLIRACQAKPRIYFPALLPIASPTAA